MNGRGDGLDMRSGAFLKLGVLLTVLSLAGCGGSGSHTPAMNISVTGVAGTGDPLPGATITLKTRGGVSKNTTSAGDGTFTVDVTGLTGPFMLRAVSSSGTLTYYSVAISSGTTNIDPFTDLAVKAYFIALGQDVTTVFNNLSSTSLLPSSIDLGNLSAALSGILGPTLIKDGVTSPNAFNIFSTPFVANQTGFDLLLHDTAFNQLNFVTTTGTLQQTVTTTPGSGTINFANTTTDSVAGTTSTSSVDVDISADTLQKQTDELDAIAAINTLWGNILSVVNQKGASISATDLAPFFDANFLDRSRNTTFFASQLAILFGELTPGNTLSLASTSQVFGFSDPNPGTPTITTEIDLNVRNNSSGTSFVFPVFKFENNIFNNDGRPGLVYIKQADGSYKFYGDQSISYLALNIVANNFYTAGAPAQSDIFTLEAYAPFATPPSVTTPAGIGTIDHVTVSNPNGQLPDCTNNSPYPLGSNLLTLNEYLNGGAAVTLNGVELFVTCGNQQEIAVQATPPAGTRYTVTSTTPQATDNVITAQIHSQTNEAANLLTINGVGAATFLGSNAAHVANVVNTQLALTWSLPSTFAINTMFIDCVLFDGAQNQYVLAPIYLQPTATSGSSATILPNLPSTTLPTVDVLCTLTFTGVSGESLSAAFNIPL